MILQLFKKFHNLHHSLRNSKSSWAQTKNHPKLIWIIFSLLSLCHYMIQTLRWTLVSYALLFQTTSLDNAKIMNIIKDILTHLLKIVIEAQNNMKLLKIHHHSQHSHHKSSWIPNAKVQLILLLPQLKELVFVIS